MRRTALTMDYPLRSLPDLAPADLPQLETSHTGQHHYLIPQAYGLDGVDGASVFTLQAQYPGGRVATTQDHAARPFNLSTVLPGYTQHDAEFATNGQLWSAVSAGPASPMGLPTQPRKRKARTLRADDWEPYKKRILDLHIAQRLPLSKVRQMIEEEYGFKAQYVASVRAR
jgi:hypothetical protein